MARGLYPTRWTPRGLISHLLPHLFRKPRNASESLGAPKTQLVPLDADLQHLHRTRKQIRFSKLLRERYGENCKGLSGERKKGTNLCVATGKWQEIKHMAPTHIFPTQLGDAISAHAMGGPSLWEVGNGLLLPLPMKQAFEDWAIVIVPQSGGADGAVEPVKYRGSARYYVRILDHKHEALSRPLYPHSVSEDGVAAPPRLDDTHRRDTLKDLDGKELLFRNTKPPGHRYLYFHTCCAVWKQVCLANPDPRNLHAFWASFYQHITTLWPAEFVKTNSITEIFHPRNIGAKRPDTNGHLTRQQLHAPPGAPRMPEEGEAADEMETSVSAT